VMVDEGICCTCRIMGAHNYLVLVGNFRSD
jgi:hypothetical protein